MVPACICKMMCVYSLVGCKVSERWGILKRNVEVSVGCGGWLL